MFESEDFDIDDTVFESDWLSDPDSTKNLKKTEIRSERKSNKENDANDILVSPQKSVFQNIFSKPKTVKVKKVVERKFPGPAGLLPGRQDLTVDVSQLEDNYKENYSYVVNNEILCSQVSGLKFKEESWLKMVEDFENTSVNLPEKYNIGWIKNKAILKRLINGKAPFLAASIKKIECLSNIPAFVLEDPTGNSVRENLRALIFYYLLKYEHLSIILKIYQIWQLSENLSDQTTKYIYIALLKMNYYWVNFFLGEIEAVISRDLYEELSEYLTLNSVIILKQFSVLSMHNCKKLYVIITSNNLVKTYSFKTEVFENCDDEKVSENAREIEVLTIDVSNEDIIEEIKSVKDKYGNSFNVTRTKTDSSKDSFQRKIENELQRIDFMEKFDNSENNSKSRTITQNKQKHNFDFQPRPSTSNNSNHDNNLFNDLNLNLADFEDDLDLPSDITGDLEEPSHINATFPNRNNPLVTSTKEELTKTNSTKHGGFNVEAPPSKKFKPTITRFKFKTKDEADSSVAVDENLDLMKETRKKDVLKSKNTPNRIDCCQISILSQNHEDLEEIKNAFTDMDPDTLFEDF